LLELFCTICKQWIFFTNTVHEALMSRTTNCSSFRTFSISVTPFLHFDLPCQFSYKQNWKITLERLRSNETIEAHS
jgi:hypothetical protein